MGRRKKRAAPGILGVVLLALVAGGYGWLRSGASLTEPEPDTVRVGGVSEGEFFSDSDVGSAERVDLIGSKTAEPFVKGNRSRGVHLRVDANAEFP